jgi:putative redox protein
MGTVMAHATVICEHKYVAQAISGHHRLICDEPVSNGGSDAGPAPYDLLLASLGACSAITLRMYANRKGWDLGKITVGLRYTRGEDGKERIDRRVSFSKPLETDQKNRLLEIMGKTPVTRTLLQGLTIESSLAE